jgi:hypothetical protein
VDLRAGCVMEGYIRSLRLAVDDTAVFRGRVDLTQGAAAKAPEAPQNGGAAQNGGAD